MIRIVKYSAFILLLITSLSIAQAKDLKNNTGSKDLNEIKKTTIIVPESAIKDYENDHPLKYVSKYKFRKDRKIIEASVTQDGMSLKYAHKELRNDKEIVLIAVQENGLSLQYANKILKRDFEIVMAAVKQNGTAMKYAHRELRGNKDVIFSAVKNYTNINSRLNRKIIE